MTGKVKWFDDKKGYGIITPDDGSEDVFVHHTAIAGEGICALTEGDRVEFDVEDTPRGRQARRGVVIADDPGT